METTQDPEQLVIPEVTNRGDETFATMIGLAQMLANLRDVAEEQEESLKKTTDQIKDIAEKRLPDLMQSLGLTEVTLRDGRKIVVKPEYYASVSKDRMAAAAAWLEQNNMAGIMKKSLVVDAERAEQLVEANVPFDTNISIHPSTLRAFVRERMEAGQELPQEVFAVHVVDKAAVKNS